MQRCLGERLAGAFGPGFCQVLLEGDGLLPVKGGEVLEAGIGLEAGDRLADGINRALRLAVGLP